MAPRVSVNGHAGEGPRNVTPLRRGVAALLSVSVVAATLAAIAVPAISTSAVAIPASAETAATTTGRGPVSLSGTISYGFSYSATGNCAGCHTSESLSVSMAVSGRPSTAVRAVRTPTRTTRTCTGVCSPRAVGASVFGPP